VLEGVPWGVKVLEAVLPDVGVPDADDPGE
jgi:hypothetical protein